MIFLPAALSLAAMSYGAAFLIYDSINSGNKMPGNRETNKVKKTSQMLTQPALQRGKAVF
jgi:hypothetical protein